MSTGIETTSFRDPSGRLAVRQDDVIRWVHAVGREELDAFLESATVRRLASDGHVVGTEPVEADEAAQIRTALAWGPDENGGTLVRHERIPFPSYPYEWPPEMLEAAARLTLDLQEGLVAEGLGLKDATPYNVLFRGPDPVFIDALSIERRDPHDPVWTPYGQFIRTFLLPLLVAKDLGIPLGTTMLAHRDGLEPETVHRMVPGLRRLRGPYRKLVTLPTWLAGRAERQGDALYAKRHMKDAARARFTLEHSVRGLRKDLKRVIPKRSTDSNWSRYMATRTHYEADDAARKDAFVQAALEATRPRSALDIGCNTGHFSAMAARHGARVVAVDLDPVSVGRVWQRAVAEDLDILPLVVNLSRPTPAVGWRNRECPSFLDRAKGRFDMVFLLAVMHHLHVTERIPLAEIVGMAHHVSRGHVVFEYVGPEDPMFRKLLRGRGHLHDDLDRDTFEAALEDRFAVVKREPLAGADRVLYLLERLEADAVADQRPVVQVA